ncbi:hypothetical protein FQN57_000277 [Myotisia sp. PD_48]|nr:hypothetical protein FQN57_000277 [Myotisia sp. PD_48]
MPGLQLPRAAFEPISPDLDLSALVESTPNFEYAVRIHCAAIEQQGIRNFEKLVLLHVIQGGKPLVVEGYQDYLERWIFSPQWLKDNHGSKVENARDITKKTYVPLTIQHYLSSLAGLASQWNPTNYKDPDLQRLYLKDIDCPPVWQEKLKDLLPLFLYYLNESTADNSNSMTNGSGQVARAGDLMSSLPSEMRAENLMCYIGHEGTYTPSHREMCATLGHNIMVEASTGAMENGNPTSPGSSIWFMTESKDRHLVSEYWLSTLGHDIEIEDHFAQINAWKSAPFKTYVVEQKAGDFILIPPLAPHQVWNRGTRTMKVAWNRTTVETLELALNEALPRARMVCRDEQYKNKALVYFTLQKYADLLSVVNPTHPPHSAARLIKDFRTLFSLFTKILLSESFSISEPRNIELIPFSSNITCSYCRGNIFNRFLTCTSCIGQFPNGEDDTFDVCMECYVIGRSCACVSKLKWVEQFRWKELTTTHENWRNLLDQFSDPTNPLQPLATEKAGLETKTLAEICQEELRRRPWVDVKKASNGNAEDEGDHNDQKRKRKISKADKAKYDRCHICGPILKWKLASCTQCNLRYCYGSLFRAFDMNPLTVLEQRNWKCPRCLKICSCGSCQKRDPSIKPFVPSGTRIGHDTRKVADPRSIECLVDFSHSNLFWLKKFGDHPEDTQVSRGMKQRIEEAARAKTDDPILEDHDMHPDENEVVHPDNGFSIPSNAVFRDNMTDQYQPTENITFEYPDPNSQNLTAQYPPAIDPSLLNPIQIPDDFDEPRSESDAVPIDPSLESSLLPKKRRKTVDDDFAPGKRLARNLRSTTRKAVTRHSAPKDKDRNESEESQASEDEPRQLRAQPQLRPRNLRARPNPVKQKPPVVSKARATIFPAKNIPPPDSDSARVSSSDLISSDSVVSSRLPSPAVTTTAKKNKMAKLQAMRWAEGNDDSFEIDAWE